MNNNEIGLLSLYGVTKSYNGKVVLNNINMNFPRGKVIGLLGPNGCGKTTLIKMVCGILTPNAGQILINNIPVSPDTKQMVSYLPERTYLSEWMKVNEVIQFFSDFYNDFDAERAFYLLTTMGIDINAGVKTLSKGTKEKVQLVLVMSRKCALYILDEPIAGVDPAARDFVLETIFKNRHPGSTIILSTHLIHDIEPILDEVIFLGQSGVVVGGDANQLRAQYGKSIDMLFREVYRV